MISEVSHEVVRTLRKTKIAEYTSAADDGTSAQQLISFMAENLLICLKNKY